MELLLFPTCFYFLSTMLEGLFIYSEIIVLLISSQVICFLDRSRLLREEIVFRIIVVFYDRIKIRMGDICLFN